MKKILILFITSLMFIGLVGCTKKEEPIEEEKEETRVINPTTAYERLDDLKADAGFEFDFRTDLSSLENPSYHLINDNLGNVVVEIANYEEKNDIAIQSAYRASKTLEGIELSGVYEELTDEGVDESGVHKYSSEKLLVSTWDDENGVHYSWVTYTTMLQKGEENLEITLEPVEAENIDLGE